MMYPLKGIGTKPGIYKTQGFSENPQIYAQFGMKGHNGIDWAAPKGTPVYAVCDGKLIFGNDPNGYGIFARIYMNDLDFVFGHFEKINGPAREVKEGEIIGYVNSSGFSTGNHLHFGVRKIINGQVVDYNNGYFGYFDPELIFHMTNVKTVKNGSEYGFYVPATNEQAIIDKALNFGIQIPTKEGGTRVDWDLFKADIVL